MRGRVAHESIFNLNDGAYRCPSSQQGYSPFSTWTRGLAWVLCGYPEQLEFLATLPAAAFAGLGDRDKVLARFLETAEATAEFFIANTPTDGVPYWDTGAPGLAHLGDYLGRAADPFNEHEPVDSSAAAIAAQGLVRLGNYLAARGDAAKGQPLPAGRAHGGAHAVRRALPLDRSRPRGAAAALRLPPAQRLGPRARRPHGPLRASRRCGATTTPASSPCSCCARPRTGPI